MKLEIRRSRGGHSISLIDLESLMGSGALTSKLAALSPSAAIYVNIFNMVDTAEGLIS